MSISLEVLKAQNEVLANRLDENIRAYELRHSANEKEIIELQGAQGAGRSRRERVQAKDLVKALPSYSDRSKPFTAWRDVLKDIISLGMESLAAAMRQFERGAEPIGLQ